MKRLLAAILALLQLSTAAVAQAAPRADGFEALKILYQRQGQTAYSPLSLLLALSMAAQGAVGETRAELLSAMGLSEAMLDSLPEEAMGLAAQGALSANAAFLLKGTNLTEEYQKLLADAYEAKVYEEDLASVREAVNQWVAEKTRGLIDSLIDQDPDPALSLVLVNALAFEADWQRPFCADDTKEGAFHAPDGDVTVDYMRFSQPEALLYAQLDGVQIARLPYQDSTISMTILLPEAGGMAALVEKLSAEGVYWQEALGEEMVDLVLPKFSIQSSLSLQPVLQALGVQKAFDPIAAEIPGVRGQGNVYLDGVVQKVRIDVDERGTKAAAATGIMAKAMSALEGEAMTVDRPFALVIRDEETGLILFEAVIENPALT